MSRFPHLLSPFTINGMTIRNRLMQTAHARHYASGGRESARDWAYIEERSRGGIGLITIGNLVIHPTGGPGRRGIAYTFLDEGREGLRRSVKAAQDHGARIFVQLNHFGGNVASDPDDYRVLWAPSRAIGLAGEQAKEIEGEEIDAVVDGFAAAAAFVRDAGADGVEVNAAHGYLLHCFLSPVTNRRDDDYGGSPENRLRLVRRVVGAIRDRVGRDLAVGLRLTVADELPGGLTVDDMCDVARSLADDGLIDFISTSSGHGPMFWTAAQTGFAPAGYLLDKIARVKAAVPGLPVFAVGGIDDPELAEAALADGKADMVAMTRGQLAEPEFARKLMEGREDEIRHCIRGNQGCLSRIFRGMPASCTVNPAAGREAVFGVGTLTPAERPGRWLVVGGGPAGLKAAEGLAQRGHKVTLVERQDELGGQVRLIRRLPGRQLWDVIRDDLQKSLVRLGVNVRTGIEVDADFVRSFGADGVIIATGAEADRSGWSAISPPPPGADGDDVVSLWEAIQRPETVGKRVILLDDEGAYRIGATALLLLKAGREVTLVSRLNSLLPATMPTLDMPVMYKELHSAGLVQRLNSWVREIAPGRVRIANLYSGEEEMIEADTVVLGTARHPVDGLYHGLKGSTGLSVHRIGDCIVPRTMDHAIYEGFLAGRELFDWKDRPFFEEDRDPARPVSVPG